MKSFLYNKNWSKHQPKNHSYCVVLSESQTDYCLQCYHSLLAIPYVTKWRHFHDYFSILYL